MIIKAFLDGWRTAWGYKRVVAVLWLANLAFALTLTMPIYDALVQSTGRSAEAGHLLGHYDWNWFNDFSAAHGALFKNLSGISLGLVLLYIVLNTFLAGGIWATLVERRPFRLATFLSAAGHHFPRLFRLMLISLALYYGLDRLFNGVAADWVIRLTENSPAENTTFYLDLLRQGLYVALFFFVNMVFDYAKMETVINRTQFTLVSALRAFAFVFRNPFRTIGLYGLIGLAQGVVLLVFSGLNDLISRQSTMGLGLGVGLSQALLWARAGFRVTYFASELALYSELNPAPAREPAMVTRPVAATSAAARPAADFPEGLVQITPPPRPSPASLRVEEMEPPRHSDAEGD